MKPHPRAALARSPRALAALALGALACGPPAPVDDSGPIADWPAYGGDAGGLRYSPLTQITRENVGRLEVAWEHHSGDVSDGSHGDTRTSFNVTPIVVGDTLYFCTGDESRVRARRRDRRASAGASIRSSASTKLQGPYPRTCRGVAHLAGSDARRRRPPARSASSPARSTRELIAIDAETGRALRGLRHAGPRGAARRHRRRASPAEYYVTSPPLAIRDVVVVGALSRTTCAATRRAASCAPSTRAAARCAGRWDPRAAGLDAAAPTGSRRPRRYTAGHRRTCGRSSRRTQRAASSSCRPATRRPTTSPRAPRPRLLLELGRSRSTRRPGAVRWHFQTVHHDLWDYDVPAQPTLFELPTATAAALPARRAGHEDGARLPARPRDRRAALPGRGAAGAAGRRAGRDALADAALPDASRRRCTRRDLTPEDAWGFTPWDRGKCRGDDRGAALRGHLHAAEPRRARSSSRAPPAARTGAASRSIRSRSVMYVNQMRVASVVKLMPRAEYDTLDKSLYAYPNELHPQLGTPYAVARHAAALAARRAVQPAAVGHAHGRRSRHREDALGVDARHDARPGAVPDLAAARRAEPRRLDRDRGRRGLHRRHHRQVPARLRRDDRRGDLAPAAAVHRATRRR